MPWIIEVYKYRGPRCHAGVLRSWADVERYRGRMIERRFSPTFAFEYPAHRGERIIIAKGFFLGTPVPVKIAVSSDDATQIIGPLFKLETPRFPYPGSAATERALLPGPYILRYVNWCGYGVLRVWTSRPVI